MVAAVSRTAPSTEQIRNRNSAMESEAPRLDLIFLSVADCYDILIWIAISRSCVDREKRSAAVNEFVVKCGNTILKEGKNDAKCDTKEN